MAQDTTPRSVAGGGGGPEKGWSLGKETVHCGLGDREGTPPSVGGWGYPLPPSGGCLVPLKHSGDEMRRDGRRTLVGEPGVVLGLGLAEGLGGAAGEVEHVDSGAVAVGRVRHRQEHGVPWAGAGEGGRQAVLSRKGKDGRGDWRARLLRLKIERGSKEGGEMGTK